MSHRERVANQAAWAGLLVILWAGTTPPVAVAQSLSPSPVTDNLGLRVADLAEAQRLSLDAEIRRTVARVRSPDPNHGNTVPALGSTAPIALVPASVGRAPVPTSNVATSPDRIALIGISRVQGQWLAEVDAGSGARLVRTGDQLIPGSRSDVSAGEAWTVASIEEGRVQLHRADTKARPGSSRGREVRSVMRTMTLVAPGQGR